MTRITLFRSRSHAIGFEAEGHTGYAEEGSDIVCAAISALCCLCRALLRRRTAKNVLLALLPAAAAVCLSLFFAGSPFSAFSAGETLSDYVNSTYAADEFAASPVYYDRKSGEYRLDLHAEDDAPPRENKKSDRAFRLEDFV